ncbi:MAG: mannosyltransferase family protein [Anaerolineae bacterium]
MSWQSLRTLVLIWFAWAIILIGYQTLVPARLQLQRPDRALFWTATETTATSQNEKPYLMEPFLNSQVSWDSEFYLAIATGGYDDPQVRAVGPNGFHYSLSYAFMPFYPFVMRIVAFPLRIFGMNPIATSTLAGVLVSLLGTLAGMIALYDIVRDELGEAGGLRAAFYLVAFPTGFFLAQVYTEGLFVGLAFCSLALMRRKHRLWAALLAICAVWTRAVGVALVIPLALPWIREGEWMDLDLEWKQLYHNGVPWRGVGKALISAAPVLAFFVWRYSPQGVGFDFIEGTYFGRGIFALGSSFVNWQNAFQSLWGSNSQMAVYYLIEFAAIALGFIACWQTRKRYPEIAWFSLAVILLSLTSGPAQGMHRYILAAPVVFIALARWGANAAFDRGWSLASILLNGLLALLFTFDMWVG